MKCVQNDSKYYARHRSTPTVFIYINCELIEPSRRAKTM